MFFVCFIGSMASDPSEHRSPRSIDGLEDDIFVTNPLGHKVMIDYQPKRIVLKIMGRNKTETVYEIKEDEYRTD